jgi:hypothetical protein
MRGDEKRVIDAYASWLERSGWLANLNAANCVQLAIIVRDAGLD